MFWILLMLFVALMVVFLIGVLELDQPTVIDEPIKICDYTYRDDFGNTYLVTSADITDNYSLLIEDYGLTLAYIHRHVFLADCKQVF